MCADESRAAGEIRRAIPSIDDDAMGDFLLHGEHIRDRAVIAFRPEMTSVGGADELRSDADPFTAFRTVPSMHRVNIELPADAANVGLSLSDTERRRAGGHTKAGHLGQTGQQFLRQAVAEILDILIRSEIGERVARQLTTCAPADESQRNSPPPPTGSRAPERFTRSCCIPPLLR